MKKCIFIFVLMLLGQTGLARFVEFGTGNEISAFHVGYNTYCIAKETQEGEQLITEKAVTDKELRHLMGTFNYEVRFVLGYYSTNLAVIPQSVPSFFMIHYGINGLISSLNDDESMYFYGLFPFGVGEMMMREVRTKNLLSDKAFEINSLRFNKIADRLAEVDATEIDCQAWVDEAKSLIR